MSKTIFEVHRGKDGCPIRYFRVVEQRGDKYLMSFGGGDAVWGSKDMVEACLSIIKTFNEEIV